MTYQAVTKDEFVKAFVDAVAPYNEALATDLAEGYWAVHQLLLKRTKENVERALMGRKND